MATLNLPPRIPDDLAERYRADGLWDDRLLADGIEAGARQRPTAFAVADNERSLTYADLAREIQSAVAALADEGVRQGAEVLLIAGNTVAGVVAYHALLRVGATIAVLDRRCGAADVRSALDVLAQTTLVVVPASERARLSDGLGQMRVVALESLAAGPRPGPWAEPDRDDARVVLFSSGTTDRPKAVVHSLNTLTAGARNMARITGANEQAGLFLVSPLTSITGVVQMHLAADRHAALILEDAFSPEASLERINACGATLLGGAPVIAERLLRAAEARADRRIALRSLALGGAMLPLPLLELATDSFGIEIARVYGSTEVPCVTGSVPGEDRASRLADDGVLLPGTEVRVGSTESPQEGLVRGPSMFLGYADGEHDAGAFENGWYRTGDLVDLAAGRLTVVGRLKEIVNRSGLKISLNEIEAALARMPGLHEYASFVAPDPETGERLAVAVRPEPGTTVGLDEVIAHLLGEGIARRNLPEEFVVWQDPLPRTASGKVVRSRLARESTGRPVEVAARLEAEA
ncbi:MAG: class I adenylate-forming enzyme family protein [Candidatus Binatia bacterium]|nr:class I adenylate-forming enzyme family protein [Candidatus Binatia bacterium]